MAPSRSLVLGVAALAGAACGGTSHPGGPSDASSSLKDGSSADAGEDAAADSAPAETGAPDGPDGDEAQPDGSPDAPGAPDAPDEAGEGGLRADRFVTSVVSFTPGPCAGFGQTAMPGIVEGPPHGGGTTKGSSDVVSLGVGGEIVLSFAPNAIVDGPGVDFLVFENPFDDGGNAQDPYAEPGEVSVSEDGVTWSTFPCTATSYPYGQCAGWHVVYSSPGNGISPVDPATAGGDPYDLADLGLSEVRFVRIVDKSGETCPDGGMTTSAGFDLDAISIVNAAMP